ncbi:MAG TPA: methyltransferase domain-containing protein, partial [Bryobacteraceae bacterium]|nr:methyltransferase domain-containing protein [Bryobacteraceae bacterium]
QRNTAVDLDDGDVGLAMTRGDAENHPSLNSLLFRIPAYKNKGYRIAVTPEANRLRAQCRIHLVGRADVGQVRNLVANLRPLRGAHVASHPLESAVLSNSGMRFAGFVVAVGLLTCASEGQKPSPDQIPINTPYVATEPRIVGAMLDLAKVTGDDTVYDLGCGDGRIVIAAAQKYGARGVGIDINPARIEEARANAREAGVDDRVSFEANDLFDADIRSATVVALYLLPDVNLRLRPRLERELKPGTRIVSHAFDMGDWKPDRQLIVAGERLYLWTIPPREKQEH